MKKLFPIIIILCSIAKTYAQIGISATNTPPNASAMLDVSSTTKGLLPPRMTSLQRTNIANPADGLLAFDSNTQSYWFRQSGVWTELSKGGSTNNYWQLNGSAGNEIKNTNSGGLWSANATGLIPTSDDTSNPPTAPVSGAGTRMMWIPSRSAFRVGTINTYLGHQADWDASNIGISSFASGWNTKAQGYGSTAMGGYSNASGIFSTALGVSTIASGLHATALGWSTTASGEKSTAMGSYGSTNGHLGSFIIHDNINENVFGITSNSLDNQMVMEFDGGFGFYSGGAADASMGFEKTIGLSVYGKGIRTYGGGNIYTENGGKIGVNTATPNATLQVNGGVSMPIKRVTSNYYVQDGDYTIVVDAPYQTVNIYLPSYLTNVGRIINIVSTGYDIATTVSIRDVSGTIEYYQLYREVNGGTLFEVRRVTMQCGGASLGGWIDVMNNFYSTFSQY
ncbi:MAG: hypothetical protein V4585_17395 [Bacteroidota bacterium]